MCVFPCKLTTSVTQGSLVSVILTSVLYFHTDITIGNNLYLLNPETILLTDISPWIKWLCALLPDVIWNLEVVHLSVLLFITQQLI